MALRNEFFATAGIIGVKNIFESTRDAKVGRREPRGERKPCWSEHDEDVRDKMQEASAGAEIPRGYLPRGYELKCNCSPAKLQAGIYATIPRELSR